MFIIFFMYVGQWTCYSFFAFLRKIILPFNIITKVGSFDYFVCIKLIIDIFCGTKNEKNH